MDWIGLAYRFDLTSSFPFSIYNLHVSGHQRGAFGKAFESVGVFGLGFILLASLVFSSLPYCLRAVTVLWEGMSVAERGLLLVLIFDEISMVPFRRL